MFQSISIHQDIIDVGLLLESMLFYGKTIAITDKEAHLRCLIDQLGVNDLCRLIDEGILELQHTEEMNIVRSNSAPSGDNVYDSGRITAITGRLKLQDYLRRICIAKTGKEGKGKRDAIKVESRVRKFNYDISVNNAARTLFQDCKFLSEAVPNIILNWIPEAKELDSIVFRTEKVEGGIRVETNLNFDALNKYYHRRIPPSHSSVSIATILANLQDTEVSLYLSARNYSEIASSAVSSNLVGIRLSHLHERCKKSLENRDVFQELVFEGQYTIREAYNNGQVDIRSVLDAIYKAQNFKKWLSGVDVDSELIKEYYREVTKGSPIDKLPNKSARWSFMTGLGVLVDSLGAGGLGTLAGIGLSAADNFLLEKMLKGWKPNQFVDDYLTSLIKK